jgi:ribosomal-protein-alanine N-acetyltransferase
LSDFNICIRVCRESDLPAVQEIEEACFGAVNALPLIALTQYRELCGSAFAIAEAASRVAGYAAGAVALGEGMELAWILGVAVSPDFQGRRIGSMLCANVVATLSEFGVRRVRATVAPDNAHSLKMFGQLGFAVVADCANYFGPERRRLIVERQLSFLQNAPTG